MSEEQSNLCLSPSDAASLSIYAGLGFQLDATDIAKTSSKLGYKICRDQPSYWQSEAASYERIGMRGYLIFGWSKSSLYLLCSFFPFQFLLLDPPVNSRLTQTTAFLLSPPECPIGISSLRFQNEMPDDTFKTAPPSFFPFPIIAILSFQVLGPKSLRSSLTLFFHSYPNIQIFGK